MNMKVPLIAAWLCLVAAPVVAAPKVVAKVGSWQLSLEQVDKELQGKFYDLEQNKYQLRMQRIQEAVSDHLLDLESKERKLTVEQLLAQEVQSKVAPVSDKEVDEFIAKNRERLPPEMPDMKTKVREFLQSRALEEVNAKFMQELAIKHKIEILLEEPSPPRVTVKGPQDLLTGNPKAPVTVIEFSDFECPYCRRVQDAMHELLAAYPDQVKLVFRHFPLDFHPKALKASEAAQCAADQGKFWEYHDALFAKKEYLEPAGLTQLADELKLDAKGFKECLDGGKHAKRVEEDLREGARLGVTGTPTFFVNGIKLVGAVPLAKFRDVIDGELAAAAKKK